MDRGPSSCPGTETLIPRREEMLEIDIVALLQIFQIGETHLVHPPPKMGGSSLLGPFPPGLLGGLIFRPTETIKLEFWGLLPCICSSAVGQ